MAAFVGNGLAGSGLVGRGIVERSLIGGPETTEAPDPLLAYSPTIYYRASDGYFTGGAVRIGNVPGVGNVNNWLELSGTTFASGTQGWSRTVVFCIDGENATNANQTIASKGKSGGNEWHLVWNRSTKLLTLTCLTTDGLTSITATSTKVVEIGTKHQVSFAYDGDDGVNDCHISVDNESLVSSTHILSIGSSDGKERLGSWYNATENFNGRIDSYGISIGSLWCLSQRAQLYNGGNFKQYADLTGLVTLTAWYDFGNKDTNSTGYAPSHGSFDLSNLTEWDWLLNSVASGDTAVQAGASHKPWVVRGLCAPLLTTVNAKQVLGAVDASGNGHDAVVPWYGSRISYDPDGWAAGEPAFMFPGVASPSTNIYNGGFLTNWTAAPDMSGTNVSHSFMCIVKTPDPWNPSPQAMTGDEWLGMTLAGSGSAGHVPWTFYGNAGGYAGDGGTAVRWLTSTKYEPVYSYHVHRWSSQRMADDQLKSKLCTAFRGTLDANEHVIFYTYDGATKTPTLIIDNIAMTFDSVHTNDNGGPGTALGTLTCRVIQFGEGMLYPDQQLFPPTYPYGSGGWAWYGPMKAMAWWTGVCLTQQQCTEITEIFKPDYADTALTPTFNFPPITTSLKQWWEPRSGYGLYTSRTLNIVGSATRATANGAAIGSWRSRYGLGPSNGQLPLHLVPDTDGHRPTLVTNFQNGLPVIHTLAASGQYLSAVTQALSQPLTLYMLVKMTRVGASYNYLFASGFSIEYGSASNTQQYIYGGSASKLWTTTQAAQELFRICCIVYNGASSLAEIDGTIVGSGTNIGTTGLTTMFFATYNGTQYMATLDLGDILLYNAAHDSTQRATMRTWLKTTCGWGTA